MIWKPCGRFFSRVFSIKKMIQVNFWNYLMKFLFRLHCISTNPPIRLLSKEIIMKIINFFPKIFSRSLTADDDPIWQNKYFLFYLSFRIDLSSFFFAAREKFFFLNFSFADSINGIRRFELKIGLQTERKIKMNEKNLLLIEHSKPDCAFFSPLITLET